MNLLSGSAVNKLQQKQVLKQQEQLEKRRRKGARMHGEAHAAVCIQRWFRTKQNGKDRQQQQQGRPHGVGAEVEDSSLCGRLRRWWGGLNSGADTFYHRHVSHDAKPTLADLAKRGGTKEQAETGEKKAEKMAEKMAEKTEENAEKKAELSTVQVHVTSAASAAAVDGSESR